MKRSIDRYWNPVLAWSEVAWKMTEISVASASVVGHRTNRMATAGPVPNARDRSEFARMGSEKIAAGIESAVALGRHGMIGHMSSSARTLALMLESTAALMALCGSQNSGQFITRQARLTRTLTRLTDSAIHFSNSRAGLAPIHSRTVANAKRLGNR